MASGILFDRRIKGEMAMQGKNMQYLQAKLNRGHSWCTTMLKEPQKMRIEDFLSLCKELHLDPAEVLSENILYRGGGKK